MPFRKGIDPINHTGQWGYQPLLICLANTADPLYLVNRSGNRPSHEGAAARFDQAIASCQWTAFKRVLLRGDTDVTQIQHLDGWQGQGVRFIFGIDAMPNLVEMAESLGKTAWTPLRQDVKYTVKTGRGERAGPVPRFTLDGPRQATKPRSRDLTACHRSATDRAGR